MAVAAIGPMPGIVISRLSDRVGLGTPIDLDIQLLDLRLKRCEGADQHLQNHSCTGGQIRFWVVYASDQSADVHDADRKHVTVFGHVPAQSVDALGSLMHQHIANPEHDPASLLFLALDRHEPHRGPLRRLANRFGIGRVVLLAFDERLDVGRWDQPHRVPKLTELPRPVVRPGARFQGNNARCLGGEELEQPCPCKTLSKHHVTRCIGPMRLENVLRDVQSDRASLRHGRLLQVVDQHLHLGT